MGQSPWRSGVLRDFLTALLEFESGISPEKHHWYCENFETRVVPYVRVNSPGNVWRDPLTGLHQAVTLTVQEYFHSLGVLHLFDRTDPSCLRKMQYSCMNPWGYIGYQVGEALLSELGYYEPRLITSGVNGLEKVVRTYYCGSLPEETWAAGVREHLFYREESSEWMIGTDVNRWAGRFTGKGGILGIVDLVDPLKQDEMMKVVMRHNLAKLDRMLKALGGSVKESESMWWEFSDKDDCYRVGCSVSGLLACCHLSGVSGTFDLLKASLVHRDQLGTPSLRYMKLFADLEVELD